MTEYAIMQVHSACAVPVRDGLKRHLMALRLANA
jgi:hypothetical protein